MLTRERTVSVMMTEGERRRAHALADAADESMGRWFRRLVSVEYERRFGVALAPDKKARVGRPKKSELATTASAFARSQSGVKAR